MLVAIPNYQELMLPVLELASDGLQKWVHFFGPVNGKTKVDSFIGYAAHLGLIRGGTPSALYC